jgi:polyadenylation factor subunit 2
MIYWIMGHEGPHTVMGRAHNYSVNTLMWHPVGHQLASAANDGIVKFWCREPPGSSLASEEGTEEAVGTRFGPITPEEAASVLPDVASHPLASSNAAFEGSIASSAGGVPPTQTMQYHHQQHQRAGPVPARPSGAYHSQGQPPQPHRGGAGGGYQGIGSGGSSSSHYQYPTAPYQAGFRPSASAPGSAAPTQMPPPPHHAHAPPQYVNRQAAESFIADNLGAGGDRKRSRFT